MAIRTGVPPTEGAQEQFGTTNVQEECLVLTAGGPINREEQISVGTQHFVETRISTKEWSAQIETIQSIHNILVAALPTHVRWDCRSGVVLSTEQTRPAMRLTVWSVEPVLDEAVNNLYKFGLPLILKNFHYAPERTSDLALKERVAAASENALHHIKNGKLQDFTLTPTGGEALVIGGQLQRPPEYRDESETRITGVIDGFRRSQRVFWIMAPTGKIREVQYDPRKFGKFIEEKSKSGQSAVTASVRCIHIKNQKHLTLQDLIEAPPDLEGFGLHQIGGKALE